MKKTKFKHSAINIYNAQHPIKITKHAKKPKNETHNQEENQSAEKGPKITDLMELADKDFKSDTSKIKHTLKRKSEHNEKWKI